MRRFYLYHVSLALVGAVWGLRAVGTILTDGPSLPLGLAGLGGVGLAVAAVYEAATTSPDESSVGPLTVWLAVLCAVLTLVGTGLLLVG